MYFETHGNGNTTNITTNVSVTHNNSHNDSSRNASMGGCAVVLALVGALLVVVPWLACTGVLGDLFLAFM